MTRGGTDDSTRLSPEEAFAVLANETRFAIVRALWERYELFEMTNVVEFADLYEEDTAVPFSTLYESVGYGDTGNFNYHLEQLVDHFVRRTDTGYELTEAGFEIARAVVAGTVRELPAIESTAIDEGCVRCDGTVIIDYDNHHVVASCSRCSGIWHDETGEDGVLFTLPFPPRGLTDRTAEEAFHATIAYNFHRIESFIAGICPDCSGVVETSLDVCTDHEFDDRGGCPDCFRQHQFEVAEVCRSCKSIARGPLTIAILCHPTVRSFYHASDAAFPFASWESFRRAQTIEEELLETDPLRIRLTVPCGDDRLRLDLDETLDVVEAVEAPSADHYRSSIK